MTRRVHCRCGRVGSIAPSSAGLGALYAPGSVGSQRTAEATAAAGSPCPVPDTSRSPWCRDGITCMSLSRVSIVCMVSVLSRLRRPTAAAQVDLSARRCLVPGELQIVVWTDACRPCPVACAVVHTWNVLWSAAPCGAACAHTWSPCAVPCEVQLCTGSVAAASYRTSIGSPR